MWGRGVGEGNGFYFVSRQHQEGGAGLAISEETVRSLKQNGGGDRHTHTTERCGERNGTKGVLRRCPSHTPRPILHQILRTPPPLVKKEKKKKSVAMGMNELVGARVGLGSVVAGGDTHLALFDLDPEELRHGV